MTQGCSSCHLVIPSSCHRCTKQIGITSIVNRQCRAWGGGAVEARIISSTGSVTVAGGSASLSLIS